VTAPTVGRIVLYRLNAGDVALIDRRLPEHLEHRNAVYEGDVYPAMVVRVFDPSTTANLQVFLDGDCSYWATSRTESGEPGHWSWPPRT
jgi:hypothetical protein